VEADATVDARGTLCPVPIIRAAARMRELPAGAVLEVLATDVAVLDDLPAWCRATGQEFIGFESEAPVFRGYARRAR
jgi:TusA-related sulfurtransferase